jgi:hypothetical protein
MQRSDLEHLIRAAGRIAEEHELVIIGSQAILGQFPDQAPARATRSMEADLLPIDALDKTDLLTGSLGELSPFHDTFGYFGDGVSLETARLPSGWQDRLIAVDNANTNGYVGLCLEVHDLLISKYFAGRDKDYEFCAAVVAAGWRIANDCFADWPTWNSSLTTVHGSSDESMPISRRLDVRYAPRIRARHPGLRLDVAEMARVVRHRENVRRVPLDVLQAVQRVVAEDIGLLAVFATGVGGALLGQLGQAC